MSATIVRQRFNVEALTEESPFGTSTVSTAWAIIEWWAAGATGESDYAIAGIRCLDAGEAPLSETYAPAFVVTPVLTFVYRSFSVLVPDGTKFIDVLVNMELVTGLDNDGYWDQIKATLHRAPPL